MSSIQERNESPHVLKAGNIQSPMHHVLDLYQHSTRQVQQEIYQKMQQIFASVIDEVIQPQSVAVLEQMQQLHGIGIREFIIDPTNQTHRQFLTIFVRHIKTNQEEKIVQALFMHCGFCVRKSREIPDVLSPKTKRLLQSVVGNRVQGVSRRLPKSVSKKVEQKCFHLIMYGTFRRFPLVPHLSVADLTKVFGSRRIAQQTVFPLFTAKKQRYLPTIHYRSKYGNPLACGVLRHDELQEHISSRVITSPNGFFSLSNHELFLAKITPFVSKLCQQLAISAAAEHLARAYRSPRRLEILAKLPRGSGRQIDLSSLETQPLSLILQPLEKVPCRLLQKFLHNVIPFRLDRPRRSVKMSQQIPKPQGPMTPSPLPTPYLAYLFQELSLYIVSPHLLNAFLPHQALVFSTIWFIHHKRPYHCRVGLDAWRRVQSLEVVPAVPTSEVMKLPLHRYTADCVPFRGVYHI